MSEPIELYAEVPYELRALIERDARPVERVRISLRLAIARPKHAYGCMRSREAPRFHIARIPAIRFHVLSVARHGVQPCCGRRCRPRPLLARILDGSWGKWASWL